MSYSEQPSRSTEQQVEYRDVKEKSGTHLDRLNTLLKDPALSIPEFRRHVSSSFSNITWLRKALRTHPPGELSTLLNLPQNKLLERI